MKRPPLESILSSNCGRTGTDKLLRRLIGWALNREDRVAELETRLRPRPMNEAPSERVLIQAQGGDWSIADPSSMPPGVVARAVGWLPLPAGKSKEGGA